MNVMTIDEFFESLPYIGWKMEHGRIRQIKTECCPIQVMRRIVDGSKTIGLNRRDISRIIHTADNDVDNEYFDAKLRQRLIEHCLLDFDE